VSVKADKIQFGINYVDTGSWLHQLNGITKFLWFIAWVTAVLMTFDIRVIVSIIVLGLWLLRQTAVPFRIYKPLLIASSAVLLINAGFMFLLSPGLGPEYLGSETVLVALGHYSITVEALYYLTVVTLKYFSMFPIALVFVFSTHPTEFSASLNRLGVPYKIAYAVSLTLRYLPDVKNDFINIMYAQQARGVDISRNVPLKKRLENLVKILSPLIFSSLDRADVVANAMVLRGFGRDTRRTWYSSRPMALRDYLLIVVAVVLVALVAVLRSNAQQRFWVPW
jgi:energy-coupling factor transport system permease protein